jgi:hypothetical protein
VKGGAVRVEQGRWWTNDAELHESPFRQAGSAAAALHHDLADVRSLRRAVVGHAVLFPDVRFEQDGPGIDRTIIYDDRDLGTPIRAFLDRVSDRWLEFHGRTGERFRPLSRSDRTALLNVVAPSFTLMPTLRARVSSVEAELVELTKEQALRGAGLHPRWRRDRQDDARCRGGRAAGPRRTTGTDLRPLAQPRQLHHPLCGRALDRRALL